MQVALGTRATPRVPSSPGVLAEFSGRPVSGALAELEHRAVDRVETERENHTFLHSLQCVPGTCWLSGRWVGSSIALGLAGGTWARQAGPRPMGTSVQLYPQTRGLLEAARRFWGDSEGLLRPEKTV